MSQGRLPRIFGRPLGTDRRWALITLVVIAVLLALLIATTAWLRPLPTSPTSAGPTVWQKITDGITNDSVPTQTALQAFAYVFKATIPGVTVPTGVDGADVPTSGTGVYRWVQAHWKELSADQQAAIKRVVATGANDVTLHLDATHAADSFDIRLAAAYRPLAGTPGAPAEPSPALQTAMSRELVADIDHIGPKLGIDTIDTGFQLFADVSLTFSDSQPGDALFLTQAAENGAGHFSPCNVTAWRNAWSTETPTANGDVSDRLHVLMTHEVIHCYQNAVFGDVGTALAMPPWITEGTALWLAADDTKIAEPMIPSMWINGYFKPEKPLTNRSYDAFGWYALFDHLRPNTIWSLMRPAWKAAAASGQRSNAFIAVLNGDADDLRDAWAPSYLRQDGWGDPWIAYGFGLPAEAQVLRHQVGALAGSGATGQLESRSNTILSVTSVDGEIAEVATTGLASVHDEGTDAALTFQSKRFCVSDKPCVCPPNSLLAGQDMAPDRLTVPFAVALNAPEGGSTWAVSGLSLEDLCGRQPTPQPTLGGGCQGCGSSNGDPHLRTVNRYRYDFQGAGEFTLLRNADSSVEIQAREEPYTGTSTVFRGVSINTAIAARVGSHRVSVYATPNGPVLHVDGHQVEPGTVPDLGGAAAVKSVRGGFEIDFADGTIVWTLSVGQWGINAVVQPSDAFRAAGIGLLGPITPGGMGVPALPDGTQLPVAPDFATRHSILYGLFADAWRVTAATSLFDYDAGKSTATYTDRNFPSDADDQALATALASPDPNQQAAAQSACAGVTDSELQADCVFDVFATGDSGFAPQYAAQQDLYDSGIAPPTGPPTGAPPSYGPVTGAQKVVEVQDLDGSTIGPDNTLYVSITDSSGTPLLLSVDPTTAAITQQAPMRVATDLHFAAGSVWASGQTTDANGQHCTVTRYDPQTLAKQGDYPIPCTGFDPPKIRSNGDEVSFVDTTKADPNTGAGTALTQIDPTTNVPAKSVPLPQPDGCCQESQGAIFCYCGNSDEWRLTNADTAFVDLGPYSAIFPAGTGFWAELNGNAVFVNSTSGPTASLPLTDQRVVGGDPTGVYLQQTREQVQLLRQSSDGSQPVQLTTAPISGSGITEIDYDYLTGNFPWFATPQGYLHLWEFKATPDSHLALWLQWAPLP